MRMQIVSCPWALRLMLNEIGTYDEVVHDVITQARYNNADRHAFQCAPIQDLNEESMLLLKISGRFSYETPQGGVLLVEPITEYVARRTCLVEREQDIARRGERRPPHTVSSLYQD